MCGHTRRLHSANVGTDVKAQRCDVGGGGGVRLVSTCLLSGDKVGIQLQHSASICLHVITVRIGAGVCY